MLLKQSHQGIKNSGKTGEIDGEKREKMNETIKMVKGEKGEEFEIIDVGE